MENLLHEFFNSKSDANKYLSATQQEELEQEFQNWIDFKSISFEFCVRPLMKHLSETHGPHSRAIVTSDHAELLEGELSYRTDDFIQD